MAPKINKTAVLIGAGNLATHLGKALQAKGIEILQVYSRTEHSASSLAESLNTQFTTSLNNVNPNADYYFVCVKDDAIAEIVEAMPEVKGIVMHTSGSIEIDALQKFEKSAVFYPLQTFSKNKEYLNFEAVPLCLEANSDIIFNEVKQLACLLSSNIQQANSKQRKTIHLAAVFACNFSNQLFAIAASLLKEQNLNFSLLYPLIDETVAKIKTVSPDEAQTGPAKRKDFISMEKHLELLKEKPQLAEIYKLLSEIIMKK